MKKNNDEEVYGVSPIDYKKAHWAEREDGSLYIWVESVHGKGSVKNEELKLGKRKKGLGDVLE